MATKKKQYVVRVTQTMSSNGDELNEGGAIAHAFIDSLRYAGLIRVHDMQLDSPIITCFDLICPHGLNAETWAISNSLRMQSFGFKTEVICTN